MIKILVIIKTFIKFSKPVNNATAENSNDFENNSSSKYYGIDGMHNIKIPVKNRPISLSHINPCSFNNNFDDLQHLLSCTKKYDNKKTRITVLF